MSESAPGPRSRRGHPASTKRAPFADGGFVVLLACLLVGDVALVLGDWITGTPAGVALRVLGLDLVALLIAWPVRRWLARSPY